MKRSLVLVITALLMVIVSVKVLSQPSISIDKYEIKQYYLPNSYLDGTLMVTNNGSSPAYLYLIFLVEQNGKYYINKTIDTGITLEANQSTSISLNDYAIKLALVEGVYNASLQVWNSTNLKLAEINFTLYIGEYYKLTVIVKYANGTYAGNKLVQVVSKEGDIYNATTDSFGIATLVLERGFYYIRCGNITTDLIELSYDRTITIVLPQVLPSEVVYHRLVVYTVNEQGKVVVGATVTVTGRVSITETSKPPNGSVELYLPEGTYTVSASLGDLKSDEKEIRLTSDKEVVLRLKYVPEGVKTVIPFDILVAIGLIFLIVLGLCSILNIKMKIGGIIATIISLVLLARKFSFELPISYPILAGIIAAVSALIAVAYLSRRGYFDEISGRFEVNISTVSAALLALLLLVLLIVGLKNLSFASIGRVNVPEVGARLAPALILLSLGLMLYFIMRKFELSRKTFLLILSIILGAVLIVPYAKTVSMSMKANPLILGGILASLAASILLYWKRESLSDLFFTLGMEVSKRKVLIGILICFFLILLTPPSVYRYILLVILIALVVIYLRGD